MRKILGSVIVALLILAGIAFVLKRSECTREIYEIIGEFDSTGRAIRAAIAPLAAAIQRCPRAETYRIVWTGPGKYNNVDRHALLYDRNFKSLGYEDDVFSRFSDKIYTADDSAIQRLAERGGTVGELPQSQRP